MNGPLPVVPVEPGSRPSRAPLSRGERTRERLLIAARHLFARRGYEGTSIGDVAERAGVGVGTVYHHFADKRALLIALLEGYETATLEVGDERGALGVAIEESDVRSAVRATLGLAVELRRLNPNVQAVGLELGRRDPDVAACCRRIEEGHRRLIQKGIEHGQRLGKVRPELDAVAGSFVLEQLTQCLVTRVAELPSEVDADPLVDEYAAMVCRYLLT